MGPQLEVLEMQQFDTDSTFCALAEVNERNEIDYACIVYIFAV